jgi:hypothetical protein
MGGTLLCEANKNIILYTMRQMTVLVRENPWNSLLTVSTSFFASRSAPPKHKTKLEAEICLLEGLKGIFRDLSQEILEISETPSGVRRNLLYIKKIIRVLQLPGRRK